MIGEEIINLGLKIWREMPMPDGDRIVLAGPKNNKWRYINLINHNVFRLDRSGNVIWQVQREEILFRHWGTSNKTPTLIDPAFPDGDCDPFEDMASQFFIRRPVDKNCTYLPTYIQEFFDTYAAGRLICLSTHDLEYDLNPDTGIAVCTGVPVN